MRRIGILFILISLNFSCSDENRTAQQFQGEALGTTYAVQFFSQEDLHFENAMDSIIDEINTSMSTYSTKSDISRINRGDSTVKVDEHFKKVFRASERIYRESNGFFDPTVGVLVNAYGFGPGKALKKLDSIRLDSLNGLVGFDKLNLSEDGTLSKENPAIYLDFNAIAKGYAIDVIAEYLEAYNIENYLIELGGELRAKGRKLNSDSEWIVGIDDPMQAGGSRRLYAKLKLENSAMATSGNYRKFRVDSTTGQRYVHTINPISGKAEKNNLLSVSVLAENCMLADGYATAFMALGLERAKEVLEDLNGVDVYMLYSDDGGEVNVYSTPGFENQLVE
ncbi:FAD:protein FMN transferase [Gramella sp. KN1008]|uniref:FAD:protein FMN transferase n=1 Tax=Gramella sp. KN1008 TaxID=2529298 RepID=UPI0010397FAE|nr:FAD:protein FMN transferase [Gramella sp. KN1008]TBW30389.1 FAD:protein FMN transferase [Gramella sp. KN1008]